MSTMIKVNLTNKSNASQNFFFFQAPACCTGGDVTYSNSLQSILLAPYSQSGSMFTLAVNQQFYAGAQQSNVQPAVGQESGYLSAVRIIDLTMATGGEPTDNSTHLSINPFGLSKAEYDPGTQPGAFRIISPVFYPAHIQNYAGSAVVLGDGSMVLSSFVQIQPNQYLDCQPILRYYIQTGPYQQGTIINFTHSSVDAACCDATTGETTFNVAYNTDGTWSVTANG